MNRISKLIELAQTVADQFDVFQSRGPGGGNAATNQALDELNRLSEQEFGKGTTQQILSKENRQSVDFYFESDATIVEVEFSLSNPYPCLEKDAFKALLARDSGRAVTKLVLIGDPGSKAKHGRPAARSVISWLSRHHSLEVETIELKRNP